MQAYRLASRKCGILNAKGAELRGGRWNRIGTAVLYTSETLALACLEVIVHYGFIPMDYVAGGFGIPDTVPIESVGNDDLPEDWRNTENDDTAAYGTEWADSQRTAVLRVPSAVIPSAFNYILNPAHSDFERFTVFDVPDDIDMRLTDVLRMPR